MFLHSYSSIYQQIKTALKYNICKDGVCTYVKNESGVTYQNKSDITPSASSFEMHTV